MTAIPISWTAWTAPPVFSFEDLFYTLPTNTTNLGADWDRGPPATHDFEANEASLVAAGKYGAYWNAAGSPAYGLALVSTAIRPVWGDNIRATGVFGGNAGVISSYIGPIVRWTGSEGYFAAGIRIPFSNDVYGVIKKVTWDGSNYSYYSLAATTWYDASSDPLYVFEVFGSSLKLYDGNGTVRLSIIDTDIPSGSRVGIWASRDSGFNILNSVKFEEY